MNASSTPTPLVGLALAAGAARRLHPLSALVPKPLCPVANVALIDNALDRLAAVGADPVVNVHHHAARIAAAVADRAHVSHEPDEAFGTAGAIGFLRAWIDGRPVVAVNADTWTAGDLRELVDGWDGTSVRVLVPGGGPFTPRSAVTGCLLPASVVARLPATPAGLYETVWRDAAAGGALEVIADRAPFRDCGTIARLLDANLTAAARTGSPALVHPGAAVTGTVVSGVVGDDVVVDGVVERSVLFPGVAVAAREHLVDAIRVPGPWGQRTFLVR